MKYLAHCIFCFVKSNLDDDNENDWKYLGVHPLIGKQLINLGFKEPTAIQREVIPSAIEKRMDIIGAAETVREQCQAICLSHFYFIT